MARNSIETNREVILSSNTSLDIQKVLQCCLETAVLFVDGVGLDQATCCRPAKDRHNDYVCTTTGEPMKQQAIQIRNGLNLLSISHSYPSRQSLSSTTM